MTHWNHRVMRHEIEGRGEWFAVHEVYYDEDGKVDGWTAEPMKATGDTLEELREYCEWMVAACDQPVLDYGD